MNLIGKTVGKYRVLSEIGRGGMGTVYQGYDPTLDRMVAIKVLPAALANDQSFVRRFQLEARSIARLDHPHIVSIFDAGTIDDVPYLVMEYLEDGSLAQLIERTGPLSPEQITSYMLQIGSALDYAHTQSFVHRDVKPSNILLNPRGWAELTDFGLVKAADVQITMVGQSMGTPTYMSPEQIQGDEVGPRSDIYSLGVVAYEAISGTPPFSGSLSQVFDGHVRREPPPLRANKVLSPAVETVLRKALNKRPDDRYPTATAFANALGAAFQAPAPSDAPTTAMPSISADAATVLAPALTSTPTVLDANTPHGAAVYQVPPPPQFQETSMSTPPPGQQPPHNSNQNQPNQTPGYGQPNQTPGYGQPNQTPGYGQPNQTPAYGQGFQQAGQQPPQYGGPHPQYGGPPQQPPRSKLPWILGGLAGILGVTVLGLLAYIVLPRFGGSDPSAAPSTVAQGSPSATASASASPSDAASPSGSSSAAPSGSAVPSGSGATVAAGLPSSSTSTPASPSASAGVGAVTTLQDVKKATIQIVAQGTFRDPEQEITNAFGSGTGFIIESSGLAITNNHVVTGAGTLDVFVAGESQPRGARVVAASECADLALIDIDGENYSYLEWSQTPLEPTVEVYAAGFPLGEPTYSATRGSINKVQTDRATPWALVASEIVHDANINPGNSGGPLVDKDGKVVGVNYAVDKEADQNFAIAREEAQRVIEELKKGTDVRSIGVNGTAIYVDDSLSGIWVASVKSGSPADKARIRAGDFITSLEGIELATDGSMLDYCKVLRGHQPTDTLSVEVLRLDDSAVYEGQLNGRELAQVTSFAQLGAANGEEATASYSGYRTVQDNTRTIQVNIPNEWGDVDGSEWIVEGENLGVQIQAAPSLDEFNQTYDEPGIIFIASRSVAQEFNENELLALLDLSEDCTKTTAAEPYDDSLYTGVYDYYENCDGGTTEAVVLTFVPDTRAYVGLVAIQLTSEADYEALDEILSSFEVIGTFTD